MIILVHTLAIHIYVHIACEFAMGPTELAEKMHMQAASDVLEYCSCDDEIDTAQSNVASEAGNVMLWRWQSHPLVLSDRIWQCLPPVGIGVAKRRLIDCN